MKDKTKTTISKFLSYVLRHRPNSIGIELDDAGWTDVKTLISQCRAHNHPLTREELDDIVANSPKQRFAFSDDGTPIRANQGHSVDVKLGYEPAEPPVVLYHGTVKAALPDIQKNGLQKMKRHHVHLSADVKTATNVGGRRGRPVVLTIDSKRMRDDGHVFYRTPNGVWLTDDVPAEFIKTLSVDDES